MWFDGELSENEQFEVERFGWAILRAKKCAVQRALYLTFLWCVWAENRLNRCAWMCSIDCA